MAYIITRSRKTGYVQMVKKERVSGQVRTTDYVCGLGSMTQGEFKHFQKWAHSIGDQEMRKRRVLNSPLALPETKEGREKRKLDAKVAASKQKKTTVKRVKKDRKPYKTVHYYPPREMIGYKGLDKGKQHTQVMMERRKEQAEEKEMRRLKALQDKGFDIRKETKKSASERVHKRAIKGLFKREREKEEGKARRARKEGFMFE